MFKLLRPALAGVAAALSLFLGAGALVSRADAMAVVVFSPPMQSKPASVSDERLATIADYDVIVFIDSSKSMSRTLSGARHWTPTPVADLPPDVSPNESRWQWCSEQTESLSKQLQKSLKSHAEDHLKVVLFNDRYKVFKDVDMSSVPTFFASNHPGGNTNANDALRSQLRAYFAARDQNEKVKPLLLAMITDGCPDDPYALRQTIIDATHRMKNPNEIAITFLQVGVDPKATQYLRELDNDLVRAKASYDIVTSKSFDQLNKSGLALALLDAVHK
jgi:hypothetical protein